MSKFNMQATINKSFLLFTIMLLMISIGVVQAFRPQPKHGSQAVAYNKGDYTASASADIVKINNPKVLGESVEAGEEAVTEPVGNKPVVRDIKETLKLFADKVFLQIQESLFSAKNIEFLATNQGQVSVPGEAMPLQNVKLYDTKNGKTITIVWDQLVEPPKTIKVARSDNKDKSPIAHAQIDGTAVGYHDTDIEIGKEYFYEFINVYSDEKESVVAGPYKVGPVQDLTLPHSPLNITFTLNQDKQVLITWQDPVDDDLESINIYRSEEDGEKGQLIKKVSPGQEEFLDESVEAGTDYYYLVLSQDVAGNESNFNLVGTQLGNKNPFQPPF